MAASNISNRSLARSLVARATAFLLAVATIAPGLASGETGVYPGPVPRATCGSGSRPETDIQGRVPRSDVDSGRALQGYTCNTEEVGHYGTTAGLKVHRYVDAAGHECAYYDSTLLVPLDLLDSRPHGYGVYVMDMSDPAHPVKTANLVTPAMLSPHESLMLVPNRGLLIADMGNALTDPGFVDIYDLTTDCRHPALLSSTPLGILGHESGLSPDGMTFWVSSTAGTILTALDISRPVLPRILWTGRIGVPHGVRIGANGSRLYVADIMNGLRIFDVSDVQARKRNPQVREISALSWPEMSIPQVAIPVTIGGHPYLVEVDEFGNSWRDRHARKVGAARIIDIGDERAPRVVSNIRLEVNMPDALNGPEKSDPGAQNGYTGYAAHYCAVPRTTDPNIVACSFIASGLRIFDIRDPYHPKELAYFNKPVKGVFRGMEPASFAMSAPAFVPERSEIWYSDSNSGFWVIRLTNAVWP